MNRRTATIIASWLLALLLPAVGCGLALGWISATTTSQECATGSATSNWGLVVYAALVLLTPAGIAALAWRMKLTADLAAPPALVGACIAVVAVFLTISVWWSGHGCLT